MLPQQIDIFTDWIEIFVVHNTAFAPYILLFLEESGIPLPIPGDVYVTFIGYQVASHQMPYWVAFGLALFTILVGASILYFLSHRWGNFLIAKIGKYLHLSEKRLGHVEQAFKKYGAWVIIFGRHIPGFRIPITIFSGISGVPYLTFLASTFISVVFWIAFYMSVGAHVGKRVLRLFHANPRYFLLLLIPLLLYVCSVMYIHIKETHSHHKKK